MNAERFLIEPIARFARASGTRQPVQLTYFSFDGERQLRHDASSMTYYWPVSKLDCSLSNGFEQLISRDETIDEHIDALLSSLVEYERQHGTGKTQVDFVTWRGIVTKFLVCPYSKNDSFELNATKLGNTIYLEEHITPASRTEKAARESDPRQRLMSYWGYKYESLATIPRRWHEASRSEIDDRDLNIVNTNIQYCSVVRTRIGPVSMILGGEVDCCDGTLSTQPDSDQDDLSEVDDYAGFKPPSKKEAVLRNPVEHYVELKTTKLHRNDRDRVSFEKFKLLKFWAQSFLLGITKIVVGYRDDDGRLQQEQMLDTLKIPGMVRSGSQSWDGNVCLNAAGEALAFIKSVILKDGNEGVWRVKFQAKTSFIEVFKVEDRGHGFLTEEYIQHKKQTQI